MYHSIVCDGAAYRSGKLDRWTCHEESPSTLPYVEVWIHSVQQGPINVARLMRNIPIHGYVVVWGLDWGEFPEWLPDAACIGSLQLFASAQQR